MGQKIHPQSFRIGISKPWPSRWFFGMRRNAEGKRAYSQFLEEDEYIRNTVHEKVGLAGIASLDIERTSAALRVIIRAARPGLIIGRGGKGIEDLSKALDTGLRAMPAHKQLPLSLNVEELKRTDVSSTYTAQQIAWDLEKRMRFRMVMRKALDNLMQNRDVKGAKILIGGRLDGGEIARQESKMAGSLPLQTLRADIDYGTATAYTTYGTIGIKVWIYKGDILTRK